MNGTFRHEDWSSMLLPGVPADYLDTPVLDPEHRALLARRDVMIDILSDTVPLPTTEAREGYFDDRHIEYWLSGRRDAGKVMAAARLGRTARVLDFGGASGRVIRHFRQMLPETELFLSDINPLHIGLTGQMFDGTVHALHNRGIPSLPFPDGYLDCVMAFSVFTHIDVDDIAWLLELRRVVKAAGHIYITIHDQATWTRLPDTVIAPMSFANEEFRAHHASHPQLSGRKVHIYNEQADVYHCNVFLGADYIERRWVPLFSSHQLAPLAHDHQTGLVFQV
jgi:SAM-dependent methyltransferase